MKFILSSCLNPQWQLDSNFFISLDTKGVHTQQKDPAARHSHAATHYGAGHTQVEMDTTIFEAVLVYLCLLKYPCIHPFWYGRLHCSRLNAAIPVLTHWKLVQHL